MTPRWVIGGSLLRLSFGFIVFNFYALHVKQRYALWGPSGIVTLNDYRHWFGLSKLGFNIFALTGDPNVFNLLFFAGFAVTIMFMIGAYTRFVTPAFALFTWSIYHRNPWVTNGGTRLLCILVLYLVIADVGSRYSFDEWRRQGKELSSGWFRTMLHNTSMILVIYQLCCVYLFSTFYKIMGPAWQQGTAIYYALSDPQFNVSPLVHWLVSSSVVVTAATYGTLLYQSSFPWLILHPRLKYVVIIAGIGFHASIAVLMGLWWFSAVLIACETVLLTDDQYAAVFNWFNRLGATLVPPRGMLRASAAALSHS